MKWLPLAALAVMLLLVAGGCEQQSQQITVTELPETIDKYSYALGKDIGTSLKRTGQEIDMPALFQGMKDVFDDSPGLLDQAECDQVLQEFHSRARTSMEENNRKAGEKNLKASEEFLASNKDKPGIETTGSGLQYEVLEKGDGPRPDATDRVTVHYEGTTIDGTVFDSSYDRGEPATFGLNQVIPGWTEGLQLMNVGSKYRFFVPPNLAYGERSPSPKIEANSLLIFLVELQGIEE